MTKTATTAPSFSALGYTLDLLLPIGDLGQQKAWQPGGAAQYWSWGPSSRPAGSWAPPWSRA